MKLLILDRDGVINVDSDAFIKSVSEWVPIPGSIEAIAALSQAGYSVYIATNQSGLGRGLFGLRELEEIHRRLEQLVAAAGGEIAGIFYCPHAPDEGCDCRKPAPGLIRQIEAHAGTRAQGAPVIGDSLRDLEAGLALGCRPVLVRTGKGEQTLRALESSAAPLLRTLAVFDDLAAAAKAILAGDW